MKYYALSSAIIAIVLISGFVSQAFAADMRAFLVPDRDRSEASFIGVRNVELRYPDGSSLAQALNGQRNSVKFELNGTATEGVLAAINQAFANAGSPVQASSVVVVYQASLRGNPTNALLSYKVEIKPTMEQFVLQRGEGGQSGHLVDLEWRGITVEGPLVVDAPQYGEMSINYPIGLLTATHPDIAAKLESSAAEVLQDPILNFEEFGTPLANWHFLFDPVGAYGGSVGLQGTEGARVLSVYSFGESSLREGAHQIKETDATATVDGTQVNVHGQSPPPSAQLTVAGFSNLQGEANGEFAIVTAEAPEGVQTSSGGFPIQVLLVFGGMMGAIAIFILIKARK